MHECTQDYLALTMAFKQFNENENKRSIKFEACGVDRHKKKKKQQTTAVAATVHEKRSRIGKWWKCTATNEQNE